MTNAELASYAATIAPEIDRVRMAMVAGAPARIGPIATRYRLTPDAAMVASMLRNLPPTRTVTVDALAALYVYQRPGYTDDALGVLRSVGLVNIDIDNGVVALTETGRASIAELMDVMGEAAAALWPSRAPSLSAALTAARKAVGHAAVTGGATFGVVFPVHVPAGLAPLTEFVELLTALRFHRFDAHVASWRARGHKAADLESLSETERALIEADTNQRAGAAYADLTQSERADLLDGLRSLPTE